MNTLTKGFAKRVLSALLATIMVFSLGIVGLTSASAADVELAETGANNVAGGHVYFDNSKTKWTDSNIQLVIGRSGFSRTYTMTKVDTYLYYVNLSDSQYHDWGDATYYAVIGLGSKWGDGNWGSDNLKNATHYTAAYTTAYNMDGENKIHLITTNTGNNGTAIDITYQSDKTTDYTKLNHKQIVYAYGANYGTTTYSANANAGTVKVAGKSLTGLKSLSGSSATTTSLGFSSSTYREVARATQVTLTATPADGYEFIGWSTTTGEAGIVSTALEYKYYSQIHEAKYYALFKQTTPPVTITATASIDTDSIVYGNSADITVDYTVSGSTSPVTLTLCDTSGNSIGTGTAEWEVNNKVITVTPKVAGNYTFKVKVTVDGVYTFTNEVTLECKNVFGASIKVDKTSQYTNDVFTFTIEDNSDLYGGATYEIYCNDEKVNATVTDKTFTVSHDRGGSYDYYVVATVEGEEPLYTNEITITVKEKIFSVYVDAPSSTMEDRAFQIKATTEFAAEGSTVTYTLVGTDGTNLSNETGIFSVTVNTVGEYTFTVTASDGVNTDAIKSVIVTITEDKGTYPVKIFFKCSDTFGYLPNAKVDGSAVELTKESAIITYNASDSATYSWYSYATEGEVDFGTKIVFAVNANRNYFYNASFTVSAGEGDFVQEGDYYCYYLALENLNGGTGVLSNISSLNENERNWTESAVNMIFDENDATALSAVNFAYAAMADANTDGDINVKDATYIQKSLANMVEASALSTSVSDVNNDGKVTIKDATAIQKQIAGL